LFFDALIDKGRIKEGSWEDRKPGRWEKKGSGEKRNYAAVEKS